jgi:hypothetical protein
MGIKSVMRKLVEGEWIHSNRLLWMKIQWYKNLHYGKVMKWYL